MYAGNIPHVRVGNYNISNAISGSKGVRQGDNLSPTFLNIFFNDVVDSFDKIVSDPGPLGSTSQPVQGLQHCLNLFGSYVMAGVKILTITYPIS